MGYVGVMLGVGFLGFRVLRSFRVRVLGCFSGFRVLGF